jgi:hypothetical protein
LLTLQKNRRTLMTMSSTRQAIIFTAILVGGALALTFGFGVVPPLVGGIAAAVGLAFTALVVLASRPLHTPTVYRASDAFEFAGTAAADDAQRALVG